jgi:hypothetical protein
MKTYSGAGVIPIIIHNNKPYFILFMLNKGTITDAGGRIESNVSVIDTAARELYEESAGLFNIKPSILNTNSMYLDIKHKNNLYYKVYFVLFNNFNITDIDYYYDNLKKIKKEKHNPFSETRNICFISLEYVHFMKNQNNNLIMLMNDHVNHVYELSGRTGLIIKTIRNNFSDLFDFYDKLSKKINIINLKRIKTNVTSYTYGDHLDIIINDLDTFC